jgi:hypothetical protein
VQKNTVNHLPKANDSRCAPHCPHARGGQARQPAACQGHRHAQPPDNGHRGNGEQQQGSQSSMLEKKSAATGQHHAHAQSPRHCRMSLSSLRQTRSSTAVKGLGQRLVRLVDGGGHPQPPNGSWSRPRSVPTGTDPPPCGLAATADATLGLQPTVRRRPRERPPMVRLPATRPP